jgi:hypothetical protein
VPPPLFVQTLARAAAATSAPTTTAETKAALPDANCGMTRVVGS